MKEILTKPEGYFGRFVFPFVSDRAYGQSKLGIIWNHGDSWQELKRYTLRTLKDFGFGKKNSMSSIMHEEVNEFLSVVETKLTKEGHWTLDQHTLGCCAINVMWSLVAGFRFSLKDKRLQEAVKRNDDIIHAVGPTCVYTIFPFLKTLFPKWSGSVDHLRIFKEMQDFLSVGYLSLSYQR